jgi:WD40 repeat protein
MNGLLMRRCLLVFVGAFLWTVCCWGKADEADANGIPAGIAHIDFSSDGKYMALTLRHSQKGNVTGHGIQMWSVETGKKLWAAEVPGQENGLLRFSPDGSRVALSGRVIKDSAGAVKVWNAASGQQEMEFTLERFVRIWSLAFSPDGKNLAATIYRPALYSSATREEKAEIKLFNIENARANQTIIAFEGNATNLTYSADGSTFVAVLNHSTQSIIQNVEVVFWDSSDYSIKERVPMGRISLHKFALS